MSTKQRTAGPAIDPSQIQRVLIYRLGSLGDTIVALPALHLVERAFPRAERRLLTNAPVHAKAPAAWAILKDSGLVHGTMSYPVGTRSPLELVRLGLAIRRFRPQVLVYLAQPRGGKTIARDLRFFRACGITHFVGVPEGELGQNLYDAASGLWEQEAARLLRSVRELGEADVNDLRHWDLRLTESELRRALDARAPLGSAPFIACGPGTKMQSNDWGDSNWRAVLARLAEAMPDRALVLVGHEHDAKLCRELAAAWRGSALNLCGQLTPRETAAALRGAELFLGPDSGPKHLAATQGVPCALVFGARDRAGVWYPPGSGHRVVSHSVDCAGCGLTTCIEQRKKCIASITVEEVYSAALDAWKLSHPQPA